MLVVFYCLTYMYAFMVNVSLTHKCWEAIQQEMSGTGVKRMLHNTKRSHGAC
jgi:hypothetical protein